MNYVSTHFMALVIVGVFMAAGVDVCIARAWNEAIYSFAAVALNFAVYFHPFR